MTEPQDQKAPEAPDISTIDRAYVPREADMARRPHDDGSDERGPWATGQGLLLSGHSGSGKSYAAAALAEVVLRNGGRVLWVSTVETKSELAEYLSTQAGLTTIFVDSTAGLTEIAKDQGSAYDLVVVDSLDRVFAPTTETDMPGMARLLADLAGTRVLALTG